ncbi:MAG: 2-keto-4-pentenoate hydratase [Deltaproteobacteria bacterium]|nr:2-keto-4-pentenoate hydratase [Deltaproteobacteria bacterium]
MDTQKAAELLRKAEEERAPIDPLSKLFQEGPTLDEAFRICEISIQRRLDQGEKLAGYKVGLTNEQVRKQLGFPDSTYGYLMESMILESGGRLDMGELIAPKIECEICFKLKRDLRGRDISTWAVLEATGGVCGAFEICDARLKDWKCSYEEFFADNGCSARVVLSGEWHPVEGVDLLGETVTLSKDGTPIAEGKGEMAMGHPARAVAWLAGKLAERDQYLKAGQIIMTGTLTPMIGIEKGSTYRADFSTLGTVEMTFS